MNRNRRTRRGMTLVEMLVAAAMSIMGMWLLSWLYAQGLESFRLSRSQADLTAQQRMVTSALTRDLQATKFPDDDTKPNNGRRLSDQRLDKVYTYSDPTDATGKRLLVGGYSPPKGGYFRAGSPSQNSVNYTSTYEGFDGVADSSRSTNHFLQFTAILPGGPNFQQFSAEVPVNSASQYFGTAAEIAYYLTPAGQTPGGVALFDLYRQQRLVARNTDDVLAYNTPVSYLNAGTSPSGVADKVDEVMVLTPTGKMAMLADTTIPRGFPNSCRLSGPPFIPLGVAPNTPSSRFGEDKLMSNVLSFEIKFTGTSVDGSWPRPFAAPNSDYPFDFLPNDGIYDTFSTQANIAGGPSSSAIPWNDVQNVAMIGNDAAPLKPIRITGIQIRLRAYDPKTRSTRQTTLILDQ